MTKTFRRKEPRDDLRWLLRDYDYYRGYDVQTIDPRSDEGKKRLAMYHADGYRGHKEPGPSWYRNLTAERPQRREAKKQLRKYLKNPEMEVILEAKVPLDYWT